MHELTKEHIDWCEGRGLNSEITCDNCGQVIAPENIVWLELNADTGEWTKAGEAGWSDTDASQGCWSFGPDCGPKVLKTQKCKWIGG